MFASEAIYIREIQYKTFLDLQKAGDIPLDTLRNDNWTVADMYDIYTGKKSATPNILDRREYRVLTEALKAEDVNRRLNEAETFIKEHQGAATSKGAHN